MNKQVNAEQVTNGAREIIEMSLPYIVDVTIEGAADIFLHAGTTKPCSTKARLARARWQKKLTTSRATCAATTKEKWRYRRLFARGDH